MLSEERCTPFTIPPSLHPQASLDAIIILSKTVSEAAAPPTTGLALLFATSQEKIAVRPANEEGAATF